MRKWIDAITGTKKEVLKEGLFDFLKKKEAPVAAVPAPATSAAPTFGRRGAAPVATKTNPDALKQLLGDETFATTIAWAGANSPVARSAMEQGATKYGISVDEIRRAITPDVIRNWQRRFD